MDEDLDELEEKGADVAPEVVYSESIQLPVKMMPILKEFACRKGLSVSQLIEAWLTDRIRQERDALRMKMEDFAKLRELLDRHPLQLSEPPILSSQDEKELEDWLEKNA